MTSFFSSVRNFAYTSALALSGLALTGGLLTVNVSPAFAVPTTATLAFEISEEGKFSALSSYDSNAKGCRVRLFGLISYPDGTTDSKTYLLDSKRAISRRIKFTARDLPAVTRVNDDVGVSGVAQLNIQTKTTCGSTVITSNAYARYLDCGKKRLKSRTPTGFIKLLAKKVL